MKQKVIKINMKSELNINGVIKEIANHQTVNGAVVQETVDVQPDNLVKVTFIDLNEESGCEGKDEDVQEKVMPAETHIKENLQGNVIQP